MFLVEKAGIPARQGRLSIRYKRHRTGHLQEKFHSSSDEPKSVPM